MLPGSNGSFRLFTVSGITVYLHWTWFIAAVFMIQMQNSPSPVYSLLVYVGLFAMVLMHEFGHALACRQVGGEAREIMLWPLGGVAYVNPPKRPGAVLWSIAAGPLVNLLLIPVFMVLKGLMESQGFYLTNPGAYYIIGWLKDINLVLLVFNLLPVFPLDGGQILQALLWFKLGQSKSLAVASAIGIVVAAGALVWALLNWDFWIVLLAAFALSRSWTAFQQAKALNRIENWPRHMDYRCPSCNTHPPVGDLWQCRSCNTTFDAFTNHAQCPGCGHQATGTACPECGQSHPIRFWQGDKPVIDAD